MCQIIVKEAGKKFNMKKLDKAQAWNEDGYGVTWFEDKGLKTFKTMDYNRFKALLSTLKAHKAVAHLRNTTRGITCEDNNHPFPIPSGVMFHNGTVSGMSCGTKGQSDTQALAELINECEYNWIADVKPLIHHIVGDTLNKLVFFEQDGNITYVNKGLGQEEDGIWYSNDYHTRATSRADTYSKTAYVNYVSDGNGNYVTEARLKELVAQRLLLAKKVEKVIKGDIMTKVFVYGTLKSGENNHDRFLGEAKLVGTAVSISKWAMIGEGLPFPYLLGRHHDKGLHITGEVYSVNKTELAALDMLEGFPSHYKKETIYVSYSNGMVSENVMVYVKTNVTAQDTASKYIANFTKTINRVAI